MPRRVVLLALYAAGTVAGLAVVAGVIAMVGGAPRPMPAPAIPLTASAPGPVAPASAAAAAAAPMTSTSPAAASNGRLTIRLLAGAPER